MSTNCIVRLLETARSLKTHTAQVTRYCWKNLKMCQDNAVQIFTFCVL